MSIFRHGLTVVLFLHYSGGFWLVPPQYWSLRFFFAVCEKTSRFPWHWLSLALTCNDMTFKSHCLKISRIPRQEGKFGFSFIPSKRPFWWTIFRNILSKFQWVHIFVKSRKVRNTAQSKIVHFQHASTERGELAWISYSHGLLFTLWSFFWAKGHLEVNTFCLLLGRLKNTTIAT